ncbi:MAG: hypothetical protein WBN32_03995 [Woeseia sp.]
MTGPALTRGLTLAAISLGSVAALADTASSVMHPDDTDFNVMGFGDISYISKDGSNRDGFAIGQGVAHLTASLSESFMVFGEFSATAKDSEYSFEIERLIVKYEFSDLYKLSAGRYHTPIGYWNSGFHHGAWLQTTVARPEMIKFGSSIVPIHFVGILLEGNWNDNSLGLNYKVGFGNGRHQNIARAGDAGDINGDKAWMVQIGAKPHRLDDIEFGIGYYNDEVALPLGVAVDESTISAFVAKTHGAAEVLVEFLHSEHELSADSSVRGDVNAWYAQFAYRLPEDRNDWKPYVRLEHTNVDDSDPLLGAQGLDYDAGILGVRWDFNPYAALKAEYRNEEFNNAGRENNLRLQLSFVLARL